MHQVRANIVKLQLSAKLWTDGSNFLVIVIVQQLQLPSDQIKFIFLELLNHFYWCTFCHWYIWSNLILDHQCTVNDLQAFLYGGYNVCFW